jgi:hypothetical protein
MTATAEDSRLAERFPEGEGWKTWGPFRLPTPPPNSDRSYGRDQSVDAKLAFMASRIEDYALIGDCERPRSFRRTAPEIAGERSNALVSSNP